eukprot:365654-Chlamydomonas_euryale.AAC.9
MHVHIGLPQRRRVVGTLPCCTVATWSPAMPLGNAPTSHALWRRTHQPCTMAMHSPAMRRGHAVTSHEMWRRTHQPCAVATYSPAMHRGDAFTSLAPWPRGHQPCTSAATQSPAMVPCTVCCQAWAVSVG